MPLPKSDRRSSSHTNVAPNITNLPRKPNVTKNTMVNESRNNIPVDTYSSFDNPVMSRDSINEHRRNSSYNMKLQPNERRSCEHDNSKDFDTEYLPPADTISHGFNENIRLFRNHIKKACLGGSVIQERDDSNINIMNFRGPKKENLNKSHDKDRGKPIMKENKLQANTNTRSQTPTPGNFGGGAKANVNVGVEKDHNKAQNYKKYSEMFRKHKENVDHGHR